MAKSYCKLVWGGMALSILVLAGCSSDPARAEDPRGSNAELVGSLGLRLTTPAGLTIGPVSYTVSGNGIVAITGNINVGQSGASARVLVGALPAGTGYAVSMMASGSGGNTCTGSSSFDIVAGQTVGVTVPLTCGAAPNRGQVQGNGTFNACPIITSLVVASLAIDIGGTVDVSAAATDDDGDPLSFSWSVLGTGGSFRNPNAASTQFLASVLGTQTLRVAVSDGKGCVTTLSGDVLITTDSAACGDGLVEQGEQCEPPNTVTCTNVCQLRGAGACGDGFVVAPETCEPPNTATCNSTCKPIACGDGKIEGLEQCDPPVFGSCSAACQGIITECGNGIIEPGETCDPPGPACSATCGPVDACDLCSKGQCAGPAAACNSAANSFGCNAILSCIATTGCAVGSLRDGAECYCGPGVDNDACFTGTDPTVPQGVCKGAVETAAGTNVPLTIGQKFFQLTSPVGAAFQTVSCRLSNCTSECAL